MALRASLAAESRAKSSFMPGSAPALSTPNNNRRRAMATLEFPPELEQAFSEVFGKAEQVKPWQQTDDNPVELQHVSSESVSGASQAI